MNLSHDDVALFHKLMWPLQFYVHQKRHILSDVNSEKRVCTLPLEETQ